MAEEYLRRLQCGELGFCSDAFVFSDPAGISLSRVGCLSLLCKDLQAYGKRGEATAIAQFYGLVLPGMILATHVFKGLRRPLLTDGDKDADKGMLVYTRKPAYDFEWIGGPQGHIEQIGAPVGKIFAVITRPNGQKHVESFPDVDGWINAWSWIDEDIGFSEAPTDWVDRYDSKVWTRKG